MATTVCAAKAFSSRGGPSVDRVPVPSTMFDKSQAGGEFRKKAAMLVIADPGQEECESFALALRKRERGAEGSSYLDRLSHRRKDRSKSPVEHLNAQ
jgi:hypothetical protein